MLNEAYFKQLREKRLDEYASVRTFVTATELLIALQMFQRMAGRWVFRGQSDRRWSLEPSLQRRTTRLERAGITVGWAGETEKYIVEEFQRRAHQYHGFLRSLPRDEYLLEWLALMQHHGAPTRLLDWTKSPYVGAFFAVADADPETESAIWAIEAQSLKEKAISMPKVSRTNLDYLTGDSHLGYSKNFGLSARIRRRGQLAET